MKRSIITARIGPATLGLVLLSGLSVGLGIGSAATSATVLSVPTVRADAATTRWEGRKVLLVRNLKVAGVEKGVDLRVSCNGCRRYRGAIRKRAAGRVRTFTGLNWLLSKGRAVTVTLSAKGVTGRWLQLAPRAGDLKVLVLKGGGCVDGAAKHVACPVEIPAPTTARQVPTTTTTTTGPVVPATPTPTTPDITIPTIPHDPIGKLLSVERLSVTQIRLTGWARDEDAGGTAIAVQTLVDGFPVDQTTANVGRDDVGAHGFDQIVPVNILTHTICVVALNVAGGGNAQLPDCVQIPMGVDISGDGYVGCAEMYILQANYGKPGVWSQADFNGDGVVDVTDLSMLASFWNPPPGEPSCT